MRHAQQYQHEAEVLSAEIDRFDERSKRGELFPPVAIISQPKKHWLDAVPWFWRLAVVIVFALAVYVYGRMLGAW